MPTGTMLLLFLAASGAPALSRWVSTHENLGGVHAIAAMPGADSTEATISLAELIDPVDLAVSQDGSLIVLRGPKQSEPDPPYRTNSTSPAPNDRVD